MTGSVESLRERALSCRMKPCDLGRSMLHSHLKRQGQGLTCQSCIGAPTRLNSQAATQQPQKGELHKGAQTQKPPTADLTANQLRPSWNQLLRGTQQLHQLLPLLICLTLRHGDNFRLALRTLPESFSPHRKSIIAFLVRFSWKQDM